MAHAVAERDGPFVLALDEVDRPRNPASVALLEFLLNRGPPNLHLAMTCRRFPTGLNVGGILLQDQARAAVVGEEKLRFSKAEVAEAFNRNLTQRELAVIMADSAGWPVAVRISWEGRMNPGPEKARMLQVCVGNWMESRLFEGLAADERDFLLDVGLFEWMRSFSTKYWNVPTRCASSECFLHWKGCWPGSPAKQRADGACIR